MKTVSLTRSPGLTIYAFPDRAEGFSLADWATHRVQLVEGTGANTGIYTGSLDETKADLWRFFEGAAQPANWNQAKGYFAIGEPEAAAAAVWSHNSRTLTSFGSLVSNIVAAIQSYLFGDGAHAIGIRVTNGTNWIERALVRVTKDGVSRTAYTDVNGWANFSLNSGTWTISITAENHTFTPTTFSVTTSENKPPFTMTQIVRNEPADPGLSNVLFAVNDAGEPVVGAKVYVELEEKNPTVNGWLVARSVHSGTTDSNGFCTLTMIQNGEFTRGGVYVITVYDATGSRVLHKRRAKVPNQSTCNAEDLIDA